MVLLRGIVFWKLSSVLLFYLNNVNGLVHTCYMPVIIFYIAASSLLIDTLCGVEEEILILKSALPVLSNRIACLSDYIISHGVKLFVKLDTLTSLSHPLYD